jgi:hypothetical protein
LALTELYLFFAALMQSYNFRWTDADESYSNLDKLNTKPKVGFTQVPPAYLVIVSKRNRK